MSYGPPGNQAPGIMNLVGKTLILSTPGPAGTVTFAASSGSNPDPNVLLFSDIKAQIEAVIATVRVTAFNGALVIQEVTPTNGVTVAKTGTANPFLGFDTGNATVGRFYLPIGAATPPVAPYWVWIETGNDNNYSVFTFED
jgi:hypothetical protein